MPFELTELALMWGWGGATLNLSQFLSGFPTLEERVAPGAKDPKPLVNPENPDEKTHPAIVSIAFCALYLDLPGLRKKWLEVDNCESGVLSSREVKALCRRLDRQTAKVVKQYMTEGETGSKVSSLSWGVLVKLVTVALLPSLHARQTYTRNNPFTPIIALADLKNPNYHTRDLVFGQVTRLFLTFVDGDSPRMVNLSAKIYKGLVSSVNEASCSADVYREAEAGIFALMQTDSFPRFKRWLFNLTLYVFRFCGDLYRSQFFDDFGLACSSYKEGITSNAASGLRLSATVARSHASKNI
jgi:hypothetical protein